MKYKTMDGNHAASYISYALSDMALIYPITPSSPMAEQVDIWSSQHKKNIFSHELEVVELQSEAGAAGALHGALQAGSAAVTYTSSQGLLLMIPNLYKMVGERLPAVLHVASRTVATSALSIFGDHSDVMATRQTGAIMLCESSVQEVMDLSCIAHMVAMEARLPVINFFDGFQTSHEIQKVRLVSEDILKELYPYEAKQDFVHRRLNNRQPMIIGTAQNPDIHFQQREASNAIYDEIPQKVQLYMDKINDYYQTDYHIVDYYGHKEATDVIISMGSVNQTIKEVVDDRNQQGDRVGMVNLRLYRPFPAEALVNCLPKTVKHIAVLDRTKEPGAMGEPLLQDVQSALFNKNITVIGGRYGIASKEVIPNQIHAVYNHLKQSDPNERFTIGIYDDVTQLSLPYQNTVTPNHELFQAKLWGFGSDGTVGASKSALKVIGDHTNKYVQGFFNYDSKKSGGLTVSHLRVANEPIETAYLVHQADMVSCHNASYLHRYDMISDLKEGGIFLLNTLWTKEETLHRLPKKVKKALAEKKAKLYIINALEIARNEGLGRHINTVMITAFFELAQFLPTDDYIALIKEDIHHAYAKKGEEVVLRNERAVDAALSNIVHVDYPIDEWASLVIKEKEFNSSTMPYINDVVTPILEEQGNTLPVSTFIDHHLDDGKMPLGTAAIEKRGIALEVPKWKEEVCTQCNECAFICPHAAIRPFVIDDDMTPPDDMIFADMKGEDGKKYRIQVSLEDCTGCGLCVEACPAKGKALEMTPYDDMKQEAIHWAFAMTLKNQTFDGRRTTVKSSQFHQPLIEFSGACSGCGETTYVKLLTQLYGDRLMIANATGCSSIWGASSPTTPYTTNEDGYGPTWSNSLFEDNAELGYGQYKAIKQARDQVAQYVFSLLEQPLSTEAITILEDWVEHYKQSAGTRQRADKLVQFLMHEKSEWAEKLLLAKDYFVKPSHWLIGGDGWAYDIGFSGLDHVLASGEDINIFVMDNEVYSNTGGQTSKATPAAAIAKFSASGKYSAKKDLGAMAMTYENVYVAQISANANPVQMIKAIEEAENYPGPSLIIGFVPCIAHGLTEGMGQARKEAILAVESGYWSLYRYNPQLKEKGKLPMTLDFKRPDFDRMDDYFAMQTRFTALSKVNPAVADELFDKTKQQAKNRFFNYARLAGQEEKLRDRLLK